MSSAQRLDVKLRAAGWRPASSGAPLAAHPIMPVQVARRRANSRRGSRLGRREMRRRTVNFNAELAGATHSSCVVGRTIFRIHNLRLDNVVVLGQVALAQYVGPCT